MSVCQDVSAVITSYNQKGLLLEALNSVLSQTMLPQNIIIVDDGSSDEESIRTLSSIESAEYEVNVIVIRQQNRGVSAARNRGINSSAGEYVLVLDGDDRIENTFAEKTLGLLKSEKNMVAVSSWMKCFGILKAEVHPEGGNIKCFLSRNNCPATHLLRRKAWALCGGYDETMRSGFEDWDFFLSVLEREPSSTIGIVKEALIEYRTTPLSSNIKSMEKRLELFRGIINKHRRSYEKYVAEAVLGVEQTSISRLLGWESEIAEHVYHSDKTDHFLQHPSYGDGGMAAAVRIAAAKADL